MTYAVKELYATLQGEGFQAGRPSIFLRFAGCNLWSGREVDRAQAACGFCDTDFVGTDGPGGGRFGDARALALRASETWEATWGGVPSLYAVCTGGEPLLQLDEPLIDALHRNGFEVAIETNGTIAAPETVDWVCVSPKAGAPLAQRRGQELKLVYPQAGLDPAGLEHLGFDHFFLQPMDGPDLGRNTELAVGYAARHPRWKISRQLHKLVGLR